MRRMFDGMLDKAAQVDPRVLALLLIVPTTVVYWMVLAIVLNMGLMPATIAGCLLLALTLVLLDRGISLFIQWTSDATEDRPQFIPV